MIRKLLLVGAGGHCLSVIDTLLSDNKNIYDEIAVIDLPKKVGTEMAGICCIGTDSDLPLLKQKGYTDGFVTVGSIGDSSLRIKLMNQLSELGFFIPNIIDKTASISTEITLSKGIFIGKRAALNIGCYVGLGAIINTGSIVDHECVVGDFCHISPGATLCGSVTIGKSTHVGAGSVVKQGIKVGDNSLIGIGSVVTRNIGDNKIAFGNPCKEVRNKKMMQHNDNIIYQ